MFKCEISNIWKKHVPFIKSVGYALAKSGGLFIITKKWAAKGLGILCYHGLSFSDEHLFRPKLFLTRDIFIKRMQYLKRHGYQVLNLGEALAKLYSGQNLYKNIVITIDDGFYNTAALAAPILQEFGFSATIFITSYYVHRNNPIFNLTLQYIFWKTKKNKLDCKDLFSDSEGICCLDNRTHSDILWRLIEYGVKCLTEDGRVSLARRVAERLDVDFDELVNSRRLNLMNEKEIVDLAKNGFDIQLHTHRHHFSENFLVLSRELADNKRALQALTPGPLNALCYPGGNWSEKVWPLLLSQGIKAAVTCLSGYNYPQTPHLALHRFLDSQHIPQIIFEAEVSGFAECIRKLNANILHHA